MRFLSTGRAVLLLGLAVGVALMPALAQAETLWQTNFAATSVLEDLLGTGEGQFNSYGTNGAAGAAELGFDAAIDALTLRTFNYTDTSMGYPGVGVAQSDFGTGNLNVARATLVLEPHHINGAAGKRGLLQVGQPGTWSTASSTFVKLDIYFNADGLVLQNPETATEATIAMAYDQVHTLDLLMVNSREASGTTYQTPTGGTSTVDPGYLHIYIDGEYQGNFRGTTAIAGRDAAYIRGLQLNIGGHQVGSAESMRGIDLFSIEINDSLDIPEPASMSLLGLGVLALRRRR